MSQWHIEYSRKLLHHLDAFVEKMPKTGRIALGHAAGEPLPLVEALVDHASLFQNLEIVHMVPMGPCRYCEPQYAKNFRHNSLFVGAPCREAVNQNRADYTPVFFSKIPRLFERKILPLDATLVCVSPPDKDGWMSFGVSVDYTEAAVHHAKLVIAEVNQQMPRTFGSRIHLSQVDYVIESDRPLPQLKHTLITDVERQIGTHIADLIEDGSCLQLGIGSIPDAVLSCLGNKRDLGIHTEMFSDGVLDLVHQGVINNQAKQIDRGFMIATFLMGSQKLYDFVHENPQVLMRPVDYTNDPCIAGQNHKLISINSALQIDLHGQVCADTLGNQQFSSVGGQVDFVRAAAQSKGGRAIIALPATAKKGSISKIVPCLDDGACVTTSRFDVDMVVTEYGVAELQGKTAQQRREALIRVAHPDFRSELRSWNRPEGRKEQGLSLPGFQRPEASYFVSQ